MSRKGLNNMKKTLNIFIMIILVGTLLSPHALYAQQNTSGFSILGPKIENLQGKDELIKYYNDLKRIRKNLGTISITSNSTKEELLQINRTLDFYIQELDNVNKSLDMHKANYKDSFDDVYTADMFKLIVNSYLLSIKNQQVLMREMNENTINSKNIVYSEYAIPIYYYLTLGDQMIAYIDSYFEIL